jgi:hypothetical protein
MNTDRENRAWVFIGRLVVAVIWDALDPLFRLADRTVTRFANETNEDPE